MVGIILNCKNVQPALSTVNFHKNNLVVLTQSALILPVFLFIQKGRTPESTISNETCFSRRFWVQAEVSRLTLTS
jgi:hypothetical protein